MADGVAKPHHSHEAFNSGRVTRPQLNQSNGVDPAPVASQTQEQTSSSADNNPITLYPHGIQSVQQTGERPALNPKMG
ncbi:MAG: hypothetical protein ACRD8W_29500, partial [Nitrososphaeraceae archaeon]